MAKDRPFTTFGTEKNDKEPLLNDEQHVPEYLCMASHYDFLLRHVNYSAWFSYLKKNIEVWCSRQPHRILEIGTGTGRFGSKFSQNGYEIYGMDISLEMLRAARLRAFNNYRVFCADVRSVVTRLKFGFIFAVHDTLNYLLTYEDLERAFQRVYDMLEDEGIFFFDLTTEANILKYFDGVQEIHEHSGTRILWKNSYDRDNKIITSTLFFDDGGDTPLRVENHVQRIYTHGQIIPILKSAGLALLARQSDYSFDPPDGETVMENFIVRKIR